MIRSKQDKNEAGKTLSHAATCPATKAYKVLNQDPRSLGIPILPALSPAVHRAFL